MKNEGPYLLEWLAHHRTLGITRFFIADNGSDDGTREALQVLDDLGYLQWIPFPGTPNEKPQLPAYRELLKRFGSSVEWLAYVDADEFIWPTSDTQAFPAFIEALGQRHPEAGAVILNWAVYGSSDQLKPTDEPVTARFQRRADIAHDKNLHYKTVVRSAACLEFANPHAMLLQSGFTTIHTDGSEVRPADGSTVASGASDAARWDGFRLNHYVVKSWSEYIHKKRARGKADAPDEGYNHEFFFAHDLNDREDAPDPRHQARVLDELARIQSALKARGFDAQERLHNRAIQSGPVPHGFISGLVDSASLGASGLRIQGWALSRYAHAAEVGRVIINGQSVPFRWDVAAERADLQRMYPSMTGNPAFRLWIDRRLLPSNIESLEVRCQDGPDIDEPVRLGDLLDIGALNNALNTPCKVSGHVDRIEAQASTILVEGWGLVSDELPLDSVRLMFQGVLHTPTRLDRVSRTDVQSVFEHADPACGFVAHFALSQPDARGEAMRIMGVGLDGHLGELGS